MKIKIIKASDNQTEKLKYYEVGTLDKKGKENILKSGWYVYDMLDLPGTEYIIVEKGIFNHIGYFISNIKLDLENFSENIPWISHEGLTSKELSFKYPDMEELSHEEFLLILKDNISM
jgi:hypothetical protein